MPAAAVAAETHEVKNVRYWAGRGSALDLGYEREFDPAWAAGAIAGLLADPARLKAMAAAGREAVDLRGAERVAAIVEELAP